MKTVQNRNQIL